LVLFIAQKEIMTSVLAVLSNLLSQFKKKLNTDTWFYAKRCLLSLLESLAKHMIVIKDTTISEIVDFLDTADQNGKTVPTVFNPLE
jgi:tetratricopeptide repeat protein 30